MYDIAKFSLKHVSQIAAEMVCAEQCLLKIPYVLDQLDENRAYVDGEVSHETVDDIRHHVAETRRHLRDIARAVANEQELLKPYAE